MTLIDLLALPSSTILLICCCSPLLHLVLLSVYRVFLHPLAKYPGPLRYKLTGWPLLWQAYKGNRHIWHLKDHEKYGPIVRIAPNTLSFNTDTALSTIYGPRSANVKKGEWYKTFDIAAGTYSSFTETDREKHAAKRRWTSPAFSVESQRVNEPLIVEILQRCCETVKPEKDGWGPKWNISTITTYLGFDIMGALVFGCDFGTVQDDKYRDLADSVLPASKFLYWISYLPLAGIVRPLLRTSLFEMIGGKPVADNNRLIDYANGQVSARNQQLEAKERPLDDDHIDMLSHLVGGQDKKTGWQPTPADLDTEALNMINAGADPYSGVLAATIFYLVHNEDVLHKAEAEIRSTFASPEEIRHGPKLNSCQYMYGCIEEGLRRTAGVPSHLPRVVLSGGITIDGHHLREGTVVGVPAYALHHTAKYFPDPWSFRPERWIESENVSRADIFAARRAFAPFSIGTRQCIGKSLAYLQLKLTLAHVLFRFDMRLAPDDLWRGGGGTDMEEGRQRTDEFQMSDALGFGRDGPMVEFRGAATY